MIDSRLRSDPRGHERYLRREGYVVSLPSCSLMKQSLPSTRNTSPLIVLPPVESPPFISSLTCFSPAS